MLTPLFAQTTIAVIWDFDKTLIPGYMQKPLFEKFSVDEGLFWTEVNALPEFYSSQGLDLVSADTLYLNHILAYVREGTFDGLNNRVLRELGRELTFYDGLPDLFPRSKQLVADNKRWSKHDISIEHYVVSTGLRQMILGSAVAEHVDDVWASEFVERTASPGFVQSSEQEVIDETPCLVDLGYVVDNTSKTRAVFEINKGTNKWNEITVNDQVAHEDRRVPFQNMIYVADGPSDIPVFSIVNQYGGKTFAVYPLGSRTDFLQARQLLEQGRVQGFGEADYSEGTHTEMWLQTSIEQIATRIADDREQALGTRLGKPPEHLLNDGKPAAQRFTQDAATADPAGLPPGDTLS